MAFLPVRPMLHTRFAASSIANPGDLPRIDTRKLGRIERIGHRIADDPRDIAAHRGIGGLAPICRLGRSRHNLLQLHG